MLPFPRRATTAIRFTVAALLTAAVIGLATPYGQDDWNTCAPRFGGYFIEDVARFGGSIVCSASHGFVRAARITAADVQERWRTDPWRGVVATINAIVVFGLVFSLALLAATYPGPALALLVLFFMLGSKREERHHDC